MSRSLTELAVKLVTTATRRFRPAAHYRAEFSLFARSDPPRFAANKATLNKDCRAVYRMKTPECKPGFNVAEWYVK